MITVTELAAHVYEMRELQKAYFASKKENRWGDKKLLAASKVKEALVDELVRVAMPLNTKGMTTNLLDTSIDSSLEGTLLNIQESERLARIGQKYLLAAYQIIEDDEDNDLENESIVAIATLVAIAEQKGGVEG